MALIPGLRAELEASTRREKRGEGGVTLLYDALSFQEDGAFSLAGCQIGENMTKRLKGCFCLCMKEGLFVKT